MGEERRGKGGYDGIEGCVMGERARLVILTLSSEHMMCNDFHQLKIYIRRRNSVIACA